MGRLDGVFASPLSSHVFVSGAICLVDMCNLRHQRIIGVGVCQHGADGKKYFRDGQRRAPLVSQNVQANAAVRVDVWVVNTCCEVDFWWLEWVICGEVDGEEEDAAGVW